MYRGLILVIFYTHRSLSLIHSNGSWLTEMCFSPPSSVHCQSISPSDVADLFTMGLNPKPDSDNQRFQMRKNCLYNKHAPGMWRTQTANDMQGPHGIHRSRSLCKLLSLYAQIWKAIKRIKHYEFRWFDKKKKTPTIRKFFNLKLTNTISGKLEVI